MPLYEKPHARSSRWQGTTVRLSSGTVAGQCKNSNGQDSAVWADYDEVSRTNFPTGHGSTTGVEILTRWGTVSPARPRTDHPNRFRRALASAMFSPATTAEPGARASMSSAEGVLTSAALTAFGRIRSNAVAITIGVSSPPWSPVVEADTRLAPVVPPSQPSSHLPPTRLASEPSIKKRSDSVGRHGCTLLTIAMFNRRVCFQEHTQPRSHLVGAGVHSSFNVRELLEPIETLAKSRLRPVNDSAAKPAKLLQIWAKRASTVKPPTHELLHRQRLAER